MRIQPHQPVPTQRVAKNDNAKAILRLPPSPFLANLAPASENADFRSVAANDTVLPNFDIAPAPKPTRKKRRRFGHRLKNAFKKIGNALKKIISPLKKLLKPLMGILSQIPGVSTIVNGIKAITSSIKMWGALFKGNFKEFGKKLWETAKNVVGALPFPGAAQAKMAMELAEKAFLAIRAGVKGQWGKFAGIVGSTAASFAGSGNGAGSFLSKVTEKFPKITSVVQKGIDVAKKAIEVGRTVLSNIPNPGGILTWFGSYLAPNVSDAARSRITSITDNLRDSFYDRAA